jgi:hypothetical protein
VKRSSLFIGLSPAERRLFGDFIDALPADTATDDIARAVERIRAGWAPGRGDLCITDRMRAFER